MIIADFCSKNCLSFQVPQLSYLFKGYRSVSKIFPLISYLNYSINLKSIAGVLSKECHSHLIPLLLYHFKSIAMCDKDCHSILVPQL